LPQWAGRKLWLERVCRSRQAPEAVVSALVEGNSLRSTCRMTDVAMNAVLKLLAGLGAACADLHDAKVRDVDAVRVQWDEIWQFIGAKAKNVTDEQKIAGWGDCWMWTAIDADIN